MVYKYPKLNPNSEDTTWKDTNCDSKFENKNAKQTPINIDTNSLQECHTLCDLEINYKPNECEIYKTEQNLFKINYNNGSYIKYNNLNYELKYIQFHTPGMHLIDFGKSQMEIILFHSLLEPDKLEKDEFALEKKKIS